MLGKANQLHIPQHFACDLYRDWQRLTAADAPQVLIWSPYQNGTDLLYGPDVLCWFNAVSRLARTAIGSCGMESPCNRTTCMVLQALPRGECALQRQHLIPAAPLPD